MKAVFIGAVRISYECLEEVLTQGVDVNAIFTVDDEIAPTTSGCVSFEELADRQGIPIYKIKSINDEKSLDIIRGLNPDVIFVIGWQQIISRPILKIPKRGVIGMHSSLLPKYRGHAPVNWAIINGERKTGITMMYLDERVDGGDIIGQKEVDIEFADNCRTIYEKLSVKAKELLRKNLQDIDKGTVRRIKQKAFYSAMPRRRPEDGIIDWSKNTLDLYNWIRALTRPYPGAFTYYHGRKIFFWEAVVINDLDDKDNSVLPGTIIGKERNNALIVKTKDAALKICDYSIVDYDDIDIGGRFG